MKLTTTDAKRLMPLALVWRRLGIPGDPPQRDGKNMRCPWPQAHQHDDAHASFGTHANGERYKCFGCGAQGDAIDLIGQWQGLPHAEAYRTFMSWARGQEMRGVLPAPRRVQTQGAGAANVAGASCSGSSSSTRGEPPRLLDLELRRLTPEEQLHLADLRSIRPEAVSLAGAMRCLYYGVICGFPSWVLTDPARFVAEARRMDGQPYPAVGALQERKAHTLRGSQKSWPVGVAVLERCPANRGTIMLVEGGPDFLAALHFAITQYQWNISPIALLGRESPAVHPRALEILRGRRVRIYPHEDADGGGHRAGYTWGRQLAAVGCQVDGFPMEGLTDWLGAPLKDLNDLVFLSPKLIHRITNSNLIP